MGEGADEVDQLSTYLDSHLKGELLALAKRKQVEVGAEAGLTKQLATLKAKTQETQIAKLAEIEALDEQCSSIQAVLAVAKELELECAPLAISVQAAGEAAAQEEEGSKAVGQRISDELKAAEARRAKAVDTQRVVAAELKATHKESAAADQKESAEARGLAAAVVAAQLQARVEKARNTLLRKELAPLQGGEAAAALAQAVVKRAVVAQSYVHELAEQLAADDSALAGLAASIARVQLEGEEAVVGAEAVSGLYVQQLVAASELATTQRDFAEQRLPAAATSGKQGAQLLETTVTFARAQADAAFKEAALLETAQAAHASSVAAAAAAREAAATAAQDARDLAVLRHLALGEALVGSVRETLLANMYAACSPMANRLSRYMFREGDVTRRCDALTAMPVEIMDALHGDGRRKTTKYTDTVTHLCTASLLSTEMFRGTLDRMVCRSGGIVAFPCGKIPSHGHAAALAFTDEEMVCIGTEEVHTITGGVGDEIVSERRGIEFKYSIAKRTLYTKFQIITMTPAIGAKALAVLPKQ